jgi:hypothetical protein
MAHPGLNSAAGLSLISVPRPACPRPGQAICFRPCLWHKSNTVLHFCYVFESVPCENKLGLLDPAWPCLNGGDRGRGGRGRGCWAVIRFARGCPVDRSAGCRSATVGQPAGGRSAAIESAEPRNGAKGIWMCFWTNSKPICFRPCPWLQRFDPQ